MLTSGGDCAGLKTAIRAGGVSAKRDWFATLDDPRALLLRQRVGWGGAIGIWSPVAFCQTISGPPALESADINAGKCAGGCKTGAAGPGLLDIVDQGLAIFQAGRASAPSWKPGTRRRVWLHPPPPSRSPRPAGRSQSYGWQHRGLLPDALTSVSTDLR